MSNESSMDRLKNKANRITQPREDDLFTNSTSISTPQTELIKTSIRLNPEINKEFKFMCVSANISKEVFIEAVIEYFFNHEDELEEVLALAKQKALDRRAKGNQRRAIAYQSKYLSINDV